jgi:DNA polymerase-3 subunit delta
VYKRDFDNLLSKKLPNIVLLYGENRYFLDYYVNFYKNKLYAKETLLEHNFEEYNYEQAKGYLSQSSLFGGVNLYILRTDKKLAKKELESLLATIKKNPTNYFLYIYEGSSSNARSLQSSFSEKNGAVWVRFFEPKANEAIDLIKSRAKELNINITPYGVTHLANVLNYDMALIDKELEKLSILQEPIEASHIDELVYSTAPLAVEKMIISLFQKEDITKNLSKIMELGEDEFSILRAIQRFLQQLFLFSAYIKIHGAPNSKEILGYALPKFIEQERANLAIRIKPAKLLKIYQELLELELKIKQSKGDKESLLYGSLVKIRTFL